MIQGMEADRLLEGSIDTHCHGYPEISYDVKMRVEDLEAFRLAAQAKMKGIVLKSHMWPTIGRLYQMQDKIEGIQVWSSITLNTSSGGLSPWITESALKQGVKVIWLPTWSARNDIARGGFCRLMKPWLPSLDKITPEQGLSVVDASGELDPNVKEILGLAKDYDVAVFTGHISPEESLAVAREAKKMGFKKLLMSHPDSRAVGATMDQVKEFAGMGYFIETTFLGLLPAFWRLSIQDLCARIREVGARRWVLSTDTFFEWSAPPSEMMRMFIASMLAAGMPSEDVDLMVRKNPSELLNA
ncbi:MAG TPA: DUF6282 family protein [Syntrophales bacterium]|nr:DUF6282 family protein [Syntrophales bacterium]